MPNTNLYLLQRAVSDLGELADELVFVGGCTTELFITDEASEGIRPTKDVDAIVEALTYAQYTDFEQRLRDEGFLADTRPDAPRCRWIKGETVLDAMPIAESILDFKNRWYAAAAKMAEVRQISSSVSIRVISPPYFIATKLEAFADRGNGDYLASHDLEDVISVVNGREELCTEISNSPEDVKTYIGEQARQFLAARGFHDALPGHVMPDTGRASMVMERFKELSNL